MKNGIDTCFGLRYKLRLMGVTLSGPTYVYGDNMSVAQNTQRPESVLKKSQTLFPIMHYICTKVVPGGRKWNHLIRLLLRDMCD
jgi:hypothetical protein